MQHCMSAESFVEAAELSITWPGRATCCARGVPPGGAAERAAPKLLGQPADCSPVRCSTQPHMPVCALMPWLLSSKVACSWQRWLRP